MKGNGDATAESLVVLTEEDISKVLAGMTDTQHRAIFQILVDTGLSIDEIIGNPELEVKGIYAQDFDLDQMALKVEARFTKDDLFSTRTIPLTSHVVVAVQDYLYSMGKTFRVQSKLFELSNRRVRQMLNEVGVKAELSFELSPAVCRRSAIVRMLKCKVPPSEVRKRLGFLRPREENMIIFALLTPTAPLSGLGYSDEMLAQVNGWSGFSAYKPEM
jgi:site-specific recombinase XerC